MKKICLLMTMQLFLGSVFAAPVKLAEIRTYFAERMKAGNYRTAAIKDGATLKPKFTSNATLAETQIKIIFSPIDKKLTFSVLHNLFNTTTEKKMTFIKLEPYLKKIKPEGVVVDLDRNNQTLKLKMPLDYTPEQLDQFIDSIKLVLNFGFQSFESAKQFDEAMAIVLETIGKI